MGTESITDQKIDQLLVMRKRVVNPAARDTDKESHLQRNYKVSSGDGHEFTLYLRQNKRIRDDFSCGLLWHMPSGESLTLVRYNGSSHYHPNRLEGDEIDFACHIHRATERYATRGLKPEGFAERSERYTTLEGALHCLVADCNIDGLKTDADHQDLFS